jgi:SAM-dependent methyltransferase
MGQGHRLTAPHPVAGSIAHQHVAAVLSTLLAGRAPGAGPVRILDVGVGDGRFLDFVLRALPCWRSDLEFECHGLDVERWTVFEKQGRPRLRAAHPGIDWDTRLALIPPRAPWPWGDGRFDFITTNQVLEHVEDKAFFFTQVRRCLAPGGVAVNLFPVREVVWEGHARMPFVHWLRDPWRRRAMLLFAALGFDRSYRQQQGRWRDRADFARRYAEVLARNTAYGSVRELRSVAAACGLTIAFTYTKDYYAAKLCSYLGLRPRRYVDLGAAETWLMYALRHVASITVLLRRDPEALTAPIRRQEYPART